jgi:magnesium-transporting ATPase (P-type)
LNQTSKPNIFTMKYILPRIVLIVITFFVSLFICMIVYENFIMERTGTKEDKYDSGLQHLGTFCLISLVIAIAIFLVTKPKQTKN